MKFLRHAELTDELHSIQERYPNLVKVESLGKSFEGRDIWVATVTDFSTGPASDKPALLLDGNIHAVELTASAAALFHLNFLVESFGRDDRVTECLKHRAFYIVPRVNPDGAELALADEPRFVRSGTRPYFYSDDEFGRLVAGDIDGDGRVLNMRVPDPNGRWKKHPDDPRVMIQREPTETGGEYFRLLPEGRVENGEAGSIPPVRPRQGIDFNRNWPSNWVSEGTQQGAGRFPLSEPETHALATFISDHPNIFTWVAGHTFSGVFLRPGFSVPDTALPFADLTHYQRVGARGTELTGYPAVNAHTGFRINHGEEIHGSVEWGYENFGIYTWIIEFWAPHQRAGIKIENYARWFFEHPAEDDLAMVKWGDEALGDAGFIDWYPIAHPELGEVELGGWDLIRTLYNPPEHLIEETISPFPEWFMWQLEMSPLLSIKETSVERLGPKTWRVHGVVENTGYLPTFCSQKSIANKATRGLMAELQHSEDVRLPSGARVKSLGELTGRAFGPSSALTAFLADHTSDRASAEWLIEAEEGAEVVILFHHARAGRVEVSIKVAEV
ncbi:MAG: carboxypeptidase [Henriciella sp.]|nr:carboxypeptidase [Henriciella sp.]